TAPEREHPVVDLDCGRDRDDQRSRGEEESKVRIHATDVHVVRPHNEAETSDGKNRPNHHAVAKDMPARVRAEQIGHDTEGRQSHDIHLRVTEEPEQMLEQERATAIVAGWLPHRDYRG